MIRYACKFCGAVVAEFDLPHRDGEVTFSSWCENPDCRAKASAEYRGLSRAAVHPSSIGTLDETGQGGVSDESASPAPEFNPSRRSEER